MSRTPSSLTGWLLSAAAGSPLAGDPGVCPLTVSSNSGGLCSGCHLRAELSGKGPQALGLLWGIGTEMPLPPKAPSDRQTLIKGKISTKLTTYRGASATLIPIRVLFIATIWKLRLTLILKIYIYY